MRTPVKITIPAAVGGSPGIANIDVPGRVFICLSADDTFLVKPDSGEPYELSTGRRFGNPTSPEYGRLTFYNYKASPVNVDAIASPDDYVPDAKVQAAVTTNVAVSGQNKDTYPKGTTGVIPGPGLTFLGVDSGGQKRKAISIWNDEPAGSGNLISVYGANGVLMHRIYPQTGHVREVGGAISIVGAGFAFAVGEDFYVL